MAAANAYKSFMPLFNRVLVQKFSPTLTTKSGIVIPEKSTGKVLEAKVVAAGPGNKDKDGNLIPMTVSAGDHVLLPEYGGTKVTLQDEEFYLFRDDDILGKFQS